MAKYPVEIGDDEGTAEAINYLLSGPAGLGQNFAGFSSYTPAYLTGNYRVPYTNETGAKLYVAPIALSTSELLDPRTFKFTFAATQSTIPFSLGNNVSVNGTTNDPIYGGQYTPIGVIECTTDYVICRTNSSYYASPATGGTIELTTGSIPNSTDANARVTVTGGTDRVFIGAQLDQKISYSVPSGTADLEVTVQVNRYFGYLDNQPVNPDYKFQFDQTVAQRVYNYNSLTGTGLTDLIDTVFASILDKPPIGYYWYILEVTFNFLTGTGKVTNDLFGFRSLSAQVVKQ